MTNGEKKLLKYPFAVNARDIKRFNFLMNRLKMLTFSTLSICLHLQTFRIKVIDASFQNEAGERVRKWGGWNKETKE